MVKLEYKIILILFSHFVGDFIFQTDEMARNKSTSWIWLFNHIAAYTGVLTAILIFVDINRSGLWFIYCLINGFIHFWVDAVTSRINSRLWKQAKGHYFFVGVGADQFIHTATLILTLMWFKL